MYFSALYGLYHGGKPKEGALSLLPWSPSQPTNTGDGRLDLESLLSKPCFNG